MNTIALIAHDGKKADIVSFVLQNKDSLINQKLIATGTTGKHLLGAGFSVETVLSGPLGGDAQIASRLAVGEIDLVIFFRDPLDKHPHEPDIQMLMRLCDVHNVPLATNTSTAQLCLNSLQNT